jgi:hypothetical protein
MVAVLAIGVCASHGSLDSAGAGLCGLRDAGAATVTRLHGVAGTVVRDLVHIPGLTPTWLAEDDAEPEESAGEETKEEEVPGVDRTWNVVFYG